MKMLIHRVFWPVCNNWAAYRSEATGAADVRILQLYIWKNVKKNHPKERFIGGELLLRAAQFIFELYLQISSALKIKPRVQWCGSKNFYLPFFFWVIVICSAETLCSCTPWPCLSLTGCSTSYTEKSYCTVLKIAPPHTRWGDVLLPV